MEPISVKPMRVREKSVYLNPLRNPISSLHQWTALKTKDVNGNEDIETWSCQAFSKKGHRHGNPLLNPVSDFHEWRALMAKDTPPLTTDDQLDEEIAVDASLSSWLASSESTSSKPNRANFHGDSEALLPSLS
ncbi:hypothetical protein DITRI_Ditri15bG0012900 [Diplodiscus trichospermus]